MDTRNNLRRIMQEYVDERIVLTISSTFNFYHLGTNVFD